MGNKAISKDLEQLKNNKVIDHSSSTSDKFEVYIYILFFKKGYILQSQDLF